MNVGPFQASPVFKSITKPYLKKETRYFFLTEEPIIITSWEMLVSHKVITFTTIISRVTPWIH